MKNYIQDGDVLHYEVAGSAVASGDVVLVDGVVGIAATDGAVGEIIALNTEGVFELAKKTAGDAILQGQALYLSTDNKAETKQTQVFLGYAWEASAADALTVNVRISYAGNPVGLMLGAQVMTGNATATDIVTQDVFVKVAGTTSMVQEKSFDAATTSNRLIYEGKETALFEVESIATVTGTATNVISLRLGKNGTTIANSTQKMILTSGTAYNMVCKYIVELATDGYVELFAANTSGTADVTVTDLVFTAKRIG